MIGPPSVSFRAATWSSERRIVVSPQFETRLSSVKAVLIRVRMLVSLISRVWFSGCSAEEAGQPVLPGGLGPVRVRPEQVVEHQHHAGEAVEGVDPVGGA